MLYLLIGSMLLLKAFAGHANVVPLQLVQKSGRDLKASRNLNMKIFEEGEEASHNEDASTSIYLLTSYGFDSSCNPSSNVLLTGTYYGSTKCTRRGDLYVKYACDSGEHTITASYYLDRFCNETVDSRTYVDLETECRSDEHLGLGFSSSTCVVSDEPWEDGMDGYVTLNFDSTTCECQDSYSSFSKTYSNRCVQLTSTSSEMFGSCSDGSIGLKIYNTGNCQGQSINRLQSLAQCQVDGFIANGLGEISASGTFCANEVPAC